MQPTYEELFAQNQILIQQLNAALLEIKELKAKVKELEEKLNTNSTNSSIPPSQDRFRQPIRKEKTGRKQGGQPGHGGHRRALYPLE